MTHHGTSSGSGCGHPLVAAPKAHGTVVKVTIDAPVDEVWAKLRYFGS